MATREEAHELQSRMTANHFSKLADGFLTKPAARFEGQRFSPKTELENNPVSLFFQLSQKRFVDVAGVRIPLSRSRLVPAGKCCFHLTVAHHPIIDVGRKVSRRRKHLVV